MSVSLADRAAAELELRRRRRARELAALRFDPERYIIDKLGWTPWRGDGADRPGQVEVLQAYRLALLQLHEKRAYEAGEVTEDELVYWTPGEIIKNVLRIEAGHTVGKTKLASGIFSHFFDCFIPSIVYTFAPSWPQIKNLLWKEIGTDRKAAALPGRILETCEIKTEQDNHFAQGRAASDAGGKGTERIHGQHGEYLGFIVDEAEGVAEFVFDAIDSMTSGGIAIVVLLANPRTRTSRFHKIAARSNVQNFRISCLHHPNVVAGREIVPNAVKRDYVHTMVEAHCEVVTHHRPDDYTFTLPFATVKNGVPLPPGTILRPDTEFLFRIQGIAPANLSDNTLCPTGRYDAAVKRDPALAALGVDRTIARVGVDVARWGNDMGTIWARHNGSAWRHAQMARLDSIEYVESIRTLAHDLAAKGVTSFHVRVDAGGGFGSGVVDLLRRDAELREMFADFRVIEVHNNGTPYEPSKYRNLGTEMYAAGAEALLGLALPNPPEALEADLTERTYDWTVVKEKAVKQLQDKDEFRKKHDGRSPDDGDGFVLCAAPDHLFRSKPSGKTVPLNPVDFMVGVKR